MQENKSISDPYENLRFRRQYLIAPKALDVPFNSISVSMANGYVIYYHADLNFSHSAGNGKSLILLGDLYDYRNPDFSNRDILDSLVKFEFQQLLHETDHYTGRYVLIYSSADEVYLFHDAAASRKIFYAQNEGKNWCSSTPHLLAKVLKYEFSLDPAVLAYYQSEDFVEMDGANIGNLTLYDQVRQVPPNHYFSLSDSSVIRYWPYKPVKRCRFSTIVDQCSEMLQGYLLAAANRHSIMIPFTAGSDSRVIVAASRKIQRKVLYYINKTDDMNDDHPDIRVPQKLLRQNGLNLSILRVNPYVDPDFEKVYFQNNPMGSRKYLAVIYNYYLNFQDTLNLPGNFVHVAKNAYLNSLSGELSGESILNLMHLQEYEIARKYYYRWFDEVKPICTRYNLKVLDLLYWEGRFANWGSQVQLDKDIAQEELIIYNSRSLITRLLSVDDKYRLRPRFRIMAEMVYKLWPELMAISFNPSVKNQVLSVLDQYGLYKSLVRAKKKLHL